jgi:hypothetical protein
LTITDLEAARTAAADGHIVLTVQEARDILDQVAEHNDRVSGLRGENRRLRGENARLRRQLLGGERRTLTRAVPDVRTEVAA